MYGILHNQSKDLLFPCPSLVHYGIPNIFKTMDEGYKFIKEQNLRNAEVRDIKIVMKYVAILIEFYTGRIKVEKDDSSELGLKITVKDKSKKTYKELAPMLMASYKREKERKLEVKKKLKGKS